MLIDIRKLTGYVITPHLRERGLHAEARQFCRRTSLTSLPHHAGFSSASFVQSVPIIQNSQMTANAQNSEHFCIDILRVAEWEAASLISTASKVSLSNGMVVASPCRISTSVA
jgi:hypothetical protein